MSLELQESCRINSISIRNYKGIASLELDFPNPRFDDEPDILIMGGPNGIGKSSIIECCALALLHKKFEGFGKNSIHWNETSEKFRGIAIRMADLLVGANSNCTDITARIAKNGADIEIQIKIDDRGIFFSNLHSDSDTVSKGSNSSSNPADEICASIGNILGYSNDPIVEDLFVFFGSYRILNFSNPNTSSFQGNTAENSAGFSQSFNLLKSTLVNEFISSRSSNVLEVGNNSPVQHYAAQTFEEDHSSKSVNKLESIIKNYLGGEIHRLKVLEDNSYDIRIKIDGEEPFSFDGLGSGHKELISTLFLIWYFSSFTPKIIFIDEPELHFNAQWHRKFIRDMLNISGSPTKNQHILTTHSADIMESVKACSRVAIQNN